MLKRFHMLTVVLAMGVTTPSVATLMRGVDGPFVSIVDTTLRYRAGGIFDFTTFNIGAGATLRFDQQMGNVTLWSLGDIRINGKIDAPGINLALNAGGGIDILGVISVESISLAGNSPVLARGFEALTVSPGGNLCLSISGCDIRAIPGPLLSHPGTLLIQPPGGIVRAVPEPATLGLVGLLLPLLAVFRHRARRRIGDRPNAVHLTITGVQS